MMIINSLRLSVDRIFNLCYLEFTNITRARAGTLIMSSPLHINNLLADVRAAMAAGDYDRANLLLASVGASVADVRSTHPHAPQAAQVAPQAAQVAPQAAQVAQVAPQAAPALSTDYPYTMHPDGVQVYCQCGKLSKNLRGHRRHANVHKTAQVAQVAPQAAQVTPPALWTPQATPQAALSITRLTNDVDTYRAWIDANHAALLHPEFYVRGATMVLKWPQGEPQTRPEMRSWLKTTGHDYRGNNTEMARIFGGPVWIHKLSNLQPRDGNKTMVTRIK